MQRNEPIKNNGKIFKLLLMFASLFINYSCTRYATCDNAGHEGNLGLLKVTWFIEPFRTTDNFGLAFDNTTMVFLKNKNSREEIEGEYCLVGNKIIFKSKNNIFWFTSEEIKILDISKEKLTLEFQNGNVKTYFNPI